jgi:signal transduction histidine kinase
LHLWFAPAGAMTAALLAYPLLSWRRLEAARRHLDWELQQLAGAGLRSSSLRRLDLEQRMAAVQQAQQRFHALQAQREEALAFLSHDVRAPLASAVQQLENDSLDAARKQRLLTQLRAAEHMVQDFLSLARAHALQPERLSEVDLAAIVHQAADALYAPAQAKSVQLLCTVPDEPVWMAGDFGLLERALGNLLRNALRFAPAGSLITLSLRVTPEQIELSVADQGPGVSAAMLPHLFEKFSPEQARGQHAQGTGLGLYFVRTVAQKLGAKSGHEAVAPHGARFWMRFPRL